MRDHLLLIITLIVSVMVFAALYILTKVQASDCILMWAQSLIFVLPIGVVLDEVRLDREIKRSESRIDKRINNIYNS